AIGARPMRGGTRPDLGETAKGGPHEPSLSERQLAQVLTSLKSILARFPNSGVSVNRDGRGVVISLSAAKFFASGDATISPQQIPVLDAVVSTLDRYPNHFEIDGFTDSMPISNARFPDNWELSAGRAASVLRYTIVKTGIQPDRFTIAGYGPYRPIGDNGTETGRALNRRVEIVVREMDL
ncbi:MAG TPA: OmpA family protein, partial [Candidatus Binataceae bacterium]|nr:OmpA family protein [Candidatus Binataceae bacterium]